MSKVAAHILDFPKLYVFNIAKLCYLIHTFHFDYFEIIAS